MKFNDLNEEAIVLTRQKKNNNITFAFSLLSTVITFNSKQGLFDINKTMELVLTDLLSHVYNLSLTNLNVIKYNHPAIDLGDQSSGVAIQVTSDGSKAKFSKTIDKFFKWNLHETYNEVWMMVISNDPLEDHSRKGIVIHVLNLSDVANSICNKGGEEFEQLYLMCEKEFGVYFPNANSSILKPMRAESINPGVSIDNFIRENGIDLNDTNFNVSEQDIRSDLILLKDELSLLNEEQRWFIYLVIKYTIESDNNKYIDACIIPKAMIMNGKTYDQKALVKETVDALSFINLAYYDEDNSKFDGPTFSVFFTKGIYEYFDYFSAIAKFVRYTGKINDLEDIIVGCDFSLID